MIQTPVLETMFLCILFQFLYKVRPETVFFPPNTSFINSIITNGFNGKPCVRDLFAHSLLFIWNNQLPIIIYVTQHRAAISNQQLLIGQNRSTEINSDMDRRQTTSANLLWVCLVPLFHSVSTAGLLGSRTDVNCGGIRLSISFLFPLFSSHS